MSKSTASQFVRSGSWCSGRPASRSASFRAANSARRSSMPSGSSLSSSAPTTTFRPMGSQYPLLAYHERARNLTVPAFVMDRPVLHTLVRELAESDRFQAFLEELRETHQGLAVAPADTH